MIIKMRKIILVLLTGIMLTGCGNDKIAYFPYGDSGTYEVTTSVTGLSLMSDGLCVLSDKNINNLTDKPSFNAKSVIVSSDEEAIYSKNCFNKMYHASLTKIMTAYVVFAK